MKFIKALLILLFAVNLYGASSVEDGTVWASSQPSCTMNYYLDASSTTVIEVQDQYELWAGTCAIVGVNGESTAWFNGYEDAEGYCRGAVCRAKKKFRYYIMVCGCARSPQATPSVLETGIFINDAHYEEIEVSPYLANQAKDSPFTTACIAVLEENDFVTVKAKNKTGTEDYQLDHMQIVIFVVGGAN